MQDNIVTRVVVLCLVSLVGGGLAAMPSSATAATGTWVSPAWMAQGKYGGILKLVTNTWMSSPMEEVLTWPRVRQPKDADHAEAKKLLADAGHPDGFKTSYLSYPPYEDMAVVIKQQLKKIGIDAELRAVDANTAFAAQARGNYAISGILHGPTILDPDEIFQCCYLPGGPRNQLGWEHARVTALYEQQARESDQAKRRALTLQAEALIGQGETSWMTLYWGTFGNLVNRQVKNFHLPLSPHQANTHEHLWLEAR